MLNASIIEHVEESKWISPMVVQDKKTRKMCICVDLRKLNNACLHDPFLTSFTNEVLESVEGQEFYCVLEHERPMILNEAHVGVVGGHYARKETVRKILQARLWWPTLHANARDYCRNCDIFQRTGNLLR